MNCIECHKLKLPTDKVKRIYTIYSKLKRKNWIWSEPFPRKVNAMIILAARGQCNSISFNAAPA